MCESSMSGNSEASAVTLFLQSMEAYNIIAAKGLYELCARRKGSQPYTFNLSRVF